MSAYVPCSHLCPWVGLVSCVAILEHSKEVTSQEREASQASFQASRQVTSQNCAVPVRGKQGWKKQAPQAGGAALFSRWMLGSPFASLLVALNIVLKCNVLRSQAPTPTTVFTALRSFVQTPGHKSSLQHPRKFESFVLSAHSRS